MFSAVLATTGVGLGSVPAMASSESASAVVGDPEVVLVAPVSGASVSSGDGSWTEPSPGAAPGTSNGLPFGAYRCAQLQHVEACEPRGHDLSG